MIDNSKVGITDLQRLRDFIKSLPQELKNDFIQNYLIVERDYPLFTQEDLETLFITDNWDELEKIGWLTEC